MDQKRSKLHQMDTGFVFLLYVLFAITAFTAVLVGVKQYQSTVAQMNTNYEVRTAASYLAEKIRQYDAADCIALTTIGDTKPVEALRLSSSSGDMVYHTYLYCYGGYLKELCVTEDSIFSLSSGQNITPLEKLSFAYDNNQLLTLSLTYQDKSTQTLAVYLHCMLTKEVLP